MDVQEPIIEWLRGQGVSTILLFFLVLGIYRACCWLGNNFLIPIRDAIIKHLEAVDTHLAKNSLALYEQAKILQSTETKMEHMATIIKKMFALLIGKKK